MAGDEPIQCQCKATNTLSDQEVEDIKTLIRSPQIIYTQHRRGTPPKVDSPFSDAIYQGGGDRKKLEIKF